MGRPAIALGILGGMGCNFVYLASGSPRRRELLDQIGVQYQVIAMAVDESARAGEAARDYVARVAEDKARAAVAALGERAALAERAVLGDRASTAARHPVLAADTAVVVDGRILGKPRDRADALSMLACLSGRSHEVLTAVTLAVADDIRTRVSASEVTFRVIGRAEAQAYWDTGEPRDKAGAYAIQGRAAVFIAHLKGSYSGVMGLPLFETAELLHGVGPV